MRRNARRASLLVVFAGILVAGCAANSVPPAPNEPGSTSPPSSPTASASPATLTDPPITLRLAISDDHGKPSEQIINKFIASVAARSRGNIAIEPTFDAATANQTPKGFAQRVAVLIENGQADLALVAARTWDLAGVTSLQAMQAPYLIDNDALLVAVAKSEIGRRALDAMGSGVVGLTMWPEDLRHLFAFPNCATDFTSPGGVRGHTISFAESGVTRELIIDNLGGLDYAEDDQHLDALSCKLQGQETGLDQVKSMAMANSVATGNVTLFPKYQVLVANSATFQHLTDAQRLVIMDAATDAQAEAIAKHQTEAALSLAWCATGGSVALASDGQRQAYLATGAPVYARLKGDPLTSQLIADIQQLKAATPADPGTAAQACSGTSSFVPAPTSATSDGTGFSAAVPPDGTYRAEFVVDQLLAQGATLEWATGNSGVWTWTFDHGRYSYTDYGDLTCFGSEKSIDGQRYHLELDPGQSVDCIGGDFRWKQETDGIRLMTFIDPPTTTAQDYWDIYRWLDRVWIKID